MRKVFSRTVTEQLNTPDTFFLTGDLGFMALEEVRDAFGERFINCGIAEQNMVSVAAGLARSGFRVLVYSIAPFIYARAFEQIRNDICFSSLPVCLVGNGGGYGYGHMGPTHHALEDCAAMRALGVHVFAPAFDADVPAMLSMWNHPAYLRLGLDVSPRGFPSPVYTAWRQLMIGRCGVWVTLGPLAGLACEVLQAVPEESRPALWSCTELVDPPSSFYTSIQGQPLTVFEEHVAEGGLGMLLAKALMLHGILPAHFEHRVALRYPSGRFGSQNFHRAECGLDMDSMYKLLALSL